MHQRDARGPGESCLLLVSFAPHAEGSVLTNLHVAFNGGISGGHEYLVPLRGIGAPASTTTTDVHSDLDSRHHDAKPAAGLDVTTGGRRKPAPAERHRRPRATRRPARWR